MWHVCKILQLKALMPSNFTAPALLSATSDVHLHLEFSPGNGLSLLAAGYGKVICRANTSCLHLSLFFFGSLREEKVWQLHYSCQVHASSE